MWDAGRELAARLGVLPLLEASLAVNKGRHVDAELPLEARLLRSGDSGAFQLARLARLNVRSLPRAVVREAFPTAAFKRHVDPSLRTGRQALVRAYARRLQRLAITLPGQLRALWTTRRSPS